MALFSRAAWPGDRASVMEMEAQTGRAEGAVREWGLADRPWPWWSRRGAAGGQHTGFLWELGWQPRGWGGGLACGVGRRLRVRVRQELGAWLVVRAGRERSVPKATARLLGGDSQAPERLVWCLQLCLCHPPPRGQSGAAPLGRGFLGPHLRAGCVACGEVASNSSTKAFSWFGFIFRRLCPNSPAPDSFTGCLVLTSPL